MKFFALLGLLTLLTGCKSYEYAISDGGGGYAQVVKDKDLVVPAEPARLRLRQVSSHCVVLIDNPTTQPIAFDGGQSTIVDPKGQSRQIASQMIAGGSFVKLILPPIREPDQNPQMHFGIGFLVDSAASRKPQYLDVNPPGMEYWEWDGAGAIRLILTLRQGEQATRHEYTIRREEK
jgi:hypothetical protein